MVGEIDGWKDGSLIGISILISNIETRLMYKQGSSCALMTSKRDTGSDLCYSVGDKGG